MTPRYTKKNFPEYILEEIEKDNKLFFSERSPDIWTYLYKVYYQNTPKVYIINKVSKEKINEFRNWLKIFNFKDFSIKNI